MARGDAITDIITNGNNTTTWIQPASGDEWMMTHASIDVTRFKWNPAASESAIFGGAGHNRNGSLAQYGDVGKLERFKAKGPWKLILTNAHYLGLEYYGSFEVWWTGVKIKD